MIAIKINKMSIYAIVLLPVEFLIDGFIFTSFVFTIYYAIVKKMY